MKPSSLLLLCVSLAAACSVKDAPAGTAAPVEKIAVRVAPVERGPVVRPVHAAGRLGYSAETRLAFKVGGVVARVAVDAGDRVKKGQVLARLDPREIDAALSGAESGRVKAERDLERARLLARDRVVPEEVVQNATTAAEVARAQAAAARFNRRFAEIVAPADGVVLARLVEQGEVVGPGAPVLVLGAAGAGPPTDQRKPSVGMTNLARSARVVRAGVADRDVVRLATGDAATVELDALPGRRLTAAVAEIAPAASPGTGLFEIEVRIDDPAAATAPLAAGMIARVTVSPRAAETMTTVPIAALVDAEGSRGLVYALRADRASVEPRPVDIAFLAGECVALRGGLDGVAEVVTEGAAYLDARSAVAVTP